MKIYTPHNKARVTAIRRASDMSSMAKVYSRFSDVKGHGSEQDYREGTIALDEIDTGIESEHMYTTVMPGMERIDQ